MRAIWKLKISVSLFTREWIEIPTATVTETDAGASPSLRGSGLKCIYGDAAATTTLRLPLYEGVD